MASTGEQIMERITRLPAAQKVAAMVIVVAGLTAANYFTLISDSLTEFSGQVKKMQSLEGEVIQAQAIANNLNTFRKEKELLEEKLHKALTELPLEADIPDLIKSLYELGQKAGLTINVLEPRPEKNGEQNLYAQIPIAMSVTGSYEEIGVFFDSVRQLKRIVNVSGIKMLNPRIKNEKVLVDSTYTATTFRFLPQAKDDKKGGKK